MSDIKQSIESRIRDIIARNNEEELSAVSTLLSHFDGQPTDTWMKKIYPFDMTFSENSGFLKVDRTQLMNNSIGILHGGILMLIADTLMGTLCNEVIPEGKRVVTHEMNTYFTKKGTGRIISARADIIKKGTTTFLATCHIYSDDELIGYATGSFFLIDFPNVR
ncbi:PaaI family thioesterase [Macrococcus lamae]|nr:PaaI family thioesterase [Macrococcus lamae]